MQFLLRPAALLVAIAGAAGGRFGGSFHAAPPSTALAPSDTAAPTRFELPNGLRVWVQEDHRRPVVLVHLSYRIGSINEEPGLSGIAHYVEHMVYRATENIRNEDIYGFVDRIGGRWTGGTGSTATTYSETVPSWALDDVLRISAERMSRALFDSLEFERERSAILTEAHGFASLAPDQLLGDAVLATSFELHPYRYGSGSWARDNLRLTREAAYGFYRRYYGPNNAVLVIVGDVAVEEARRLVEEHFGPLPRAPADGRVPVIEPPQRVEKRVILQAQTARERVEILYRAPAAPEPDYPVLAVLDRALRARLERATRAYASVTVSTDHRPTPYPYVYRIALDADTLEDPEALLRAVEGEIAAFREGRVTEGEIVAARSERRDTTAAAVQESGGDPTQPPRAFPRLAERAAALDRREVFPWEIGPEVIEAARRAQAWVTAADIEAYARRRLQPWQRTIGVLARVDTGGIPPLQPLDLPPLAIPPAPRLRPSPVPARALAPPPPPAIEAGRTVLANNLVLRAVKTAGGPVALQVRIGLSAPDPDGKAGRALLAARVLAAGAALAPFQPQVATAAIPNDRHFDLRLTVPASGIDAALDALAGALSETSAPTARIAQERAKLLEALRRPEPRRDADEVTADEARRRVLAAVAPDWVAAPPATATSVSRITDDDVLRFLAELRRAPAVLAIAAPAPPPTVLELARARFDTGPRRRRFAATGLSGDVPVAQGPAVELVRDERAPQVAIAAGLPGVPRGHADGLALELLNYIVGMPYYGGRLGWALTKSGLTYASWASTISGASSGHILLSTICNTQNCPATIQAIREIVAGVGAEGIAAWELEEAKAYTLGRALLYGPREDSEPPALAAALLDAEVLGDDRLDLDAYAQAVLAVTLEKVNAAARRYYRPDRLRIVAVGAVPDETRVSPFPPGTFRALFRQ